MFDSIDAFKDKLSTGVVEDLAGDRVEVEAGSKAADLPQRQREEVEEERPLGLRRERDHLPFRVLPGLVVDVLEVGRLPAETRPVVDELAVDLARAVVDEGHAC